MSIKSQYEKRIEAYIESNPNCRMGRVNRTVVEGRVIDLPVYRLPIKYLVFNIENGRFAADLRSTEKDLGRKLNTRVSGDAARVRRILLDKFPNDTRKLREDLKKRGQLQPGVITAAGVVINANRRMATLMELYDETADDKFEFLEVVILPRNISATEIYKIEAREQYGESFIQDYPAINVLLKIKEGLNKGVPIKELAVLLGKKEKEIEEHKNQLKLLEDYSRYAYKRVDYRKIEQEKITEVITEVEKNIRKFMNDRRRPSEIKKLLDIQFEYIKSGCTYRDLRAFGKSAIHSFTTESYLDALSKLKNGKISAPSYQEIIDDINKTGAILNDDEKQIKIVRDILREIKMVQDRQFKMTPEIKKYLVEITNIISKIIKR